MGNSIGILEEIPVVEQWYKLDRNVQKHIFSMLDYVNLCRYRRVCKRWKEDIESVLANRNSSKIYDGLVEIEFMSPQEINTSYCYMWKFRKNPTEIVNIELKYMYPKKGKKARDNVCNQFIQHLGERFTRKFIQERLYAFEILFVQELNIPKEILDDIQNLIIKDEESEEFLASFQTDYSGYRFGCISKQRLEEGYLEMNETDVEQGDLIWLGIYKGINMESFKECNNDTYKYIECHSCQHIMEIIIYKVQRVFNVLNINWRDFSYKKGNLLEIKKLYEKYCEKNPQELEEQK